MSMKRSEVTITGKAMGGLAMQMVFVLTLMSITHRDLIHYIIAMFGLRVKLVASQMMLMGTIFRY